MKMTTRKDDELFDIAMGLACDKGLDAELEEFRRYDSMPCRFSREHVRSMKYILSHGGRKPAPQPVKLHFSMKRIAACVMISISFALCSCICFPEVRAEVAGLLVEFYDEYLSITDGNDSVITQEMEHRVPTYIPEGYELVKDNSTKYWGDRTYKNKEGKIIRYYQNINTEATRYFDSEGAMLSDIFVSEYKGKFLEYLDEDKKENFIMWTDGHYTYYIMAELSYEELKAIAESIYVFS